MLVGIPAPLDVSMFRDSKVCAHTLFEAQAAHAPEAVALIDGPVRLTLGDLNARANRLAWFLKERGVGAEVAVGIHMRSSPLAVAAMLGVMKAGGAFVPLDPAYPASRLKYMIDDSRPVLTLADAPHGEGRSRLDDVETVAIEDALGAERNDDPGVVVTPDHMVSVLYTSGSTGRPKGVVRTHRAIVSRLAWPTPMDDELYCHNMSLSVGLSYERIIATLMLGMPVAIVADDAVKNPVALVDAWADAGATTTTVVPAMLRQVVDAGGAALSRVKLRSIAVGGARLPIDTSIRLAQLMPNTELVNAYGGSEAGSVVRGRVDVESVMDGMSVGRPVPNAAIYVLNDRLEPVRAGEIGEVYAGGPSLARGYLARPSLTAERFIADPFSEDGGRLYRTGDLARVRPGGEIEIVGRGDRQVKVHGFRVEPGEVEAVITDHPAVAEAIVTAQEVLEDTRLIAYVVYGRGLEVTASDLIGHLRLRVPDYMLPSAIVIMEELPLNLNGKVDVSALPPPMASRPDLNVGYEQPRTPVEASVAAIWTQLLDLDRVGIHDKFIELGGDSMLAMQIIWRIREKFGIEVELQAVLDGTVAELADALQPPASTTSKRARKI